MTLVAGIDSSTQACKVVVVDAATGEAVRHGRAKHPPGTEVDPEEWWRAFELASAAAGGIDDVAAVSVGAQQHGLICLDGRGHVVRPALLWNDMRSAADAVDLVGELGGPDVWATAVGAAPNASFTVTKLRWLARHEPLSADATAAVALPHDWLTWRLAGNTEVAELRTDRSDASGTGYWSPASDTYRLDILAHAFGRPVAVPEVLGPAMAAGTVAGRSIVLGPGAGDNAAAALGLGVTPGDVVVSIGTSGVACGTSAAPVADASGDVASFADAAGAFAPLVCTLNASGVLDAVAAMLAVDLDELSRLALAAGAGAGGLTLVPYLAGERTPARPLASGSLHGITGANLDSSNIARAAVEGILCGLADGIDALDRQGVGTERVVLVGGGARLEAVQRIASLVLGRPVTVPVPDEYVALGAARQAAWTIAGGEAPPPWRRPEITAQFAAPEADPIAVRDRYAEAREHVLERADGIT